MYIKKDELEMRAIINLVTDLKIDIIDSMFDDIKAVNFERLAPNRACIELELNEDLAFGKTYKVWIYEWTNVVTAREDGKVLVNTDAWYTNTTKKLINESKRIGFVFQKDYKWYLTSNCWTRPFKEVEGRWI